jgi:hypothetical protein
MIATFTQPRILSLLYAIVGLFLAAYVALMVTAVVFAAVQTRLAQGVQEKHMQIAGLERAYYERIAILDSADPYSLGYVSPRHVEYVSATPINNLTFAR